MLQECSKYLLPSKGNRTRVSCSHLCGETLSDALVHISAVLMDRKTKANLASWHHQAGQSHTEPPGGIQRARLFTKRFTNITLHLPTAPCEVGQ